ncbi:hypothetical protein OXB_2430 [Bacillus sp. OxB-1]|uniref:hypothetical protein n=1 Tax=Bacillus sp. (strain OxB-1) TaxID=98228 RepID=UPI0005823821|nr:hypothetical protein [Bacillus sp. OxB-1]BAQ10901.1 hypothetical protein OXB_2430 [Bacillus sp. OxB-1]
MTKWRVWSVAIASSLVLAACSADTEPTPTVDETPSAQEKSAENKATSEETAQPTEPAETGTPTKTADSNEMQQKMDELQYEEFELQVEYADHSEYEAEIEKKADGSIKAEIEDSLKGVEQKVRVRSMNYSLFWNNWISLNRPTKNRLLPTHYRPSTCRPTTPNSNWKSGSRTELKLNMKRKDDRWVE